MLDFLWGFLTQGFVARFPSNNNSTTGLDMEVFSIFGPVSLAGIHLFAVVTLEARKSNGHHMLPLS